MAEKENSPEDFTPSDLFRHLQQRDSAIHDQLSANREDVETGMSLGAEALSKASTTEEQVIAIRQQTRLIELEIYRNRALITLNRHFAKLGVTVTFLWMEKGLKSLKSELGFLYQSTTSANLGISTAGTARKITEIIDPLTEEVNDFLNRVQKALE